MGTNSYASPPYSPTRFPAGVTNANEGENLGNLGQLDPSKFHTRFDDFDFLATGAWTATTTAIVAGDGGIATITAGGSLLSTASWQVNEGLRQFFKARVSLTTPAAIGLLGLVDNATPTTGVFLSFSGGSYTLQVGPEANTVTAEYPFTADEFVDVGFEHDPHTNKVYLYLNNQRVASLPDSTIPTDIDLLIIANVEGADGSLDYIFVATER